MKKFIVLLREPDGRTGKPEEQVQKSQAAKWHEWFEKHRQSGNFIGGSALSLNGKMIKGIDAEVVNEIHRIGTEIVGGYLLVQANNIDEAVEIARGLPVYQVGGYAEVRELRVDG